MNIPEFQRRRLASSAVGTPGVDNSGERLAGFVAQGASDVAGAAFKVAAQRQEAKDVALANKTMIDFDMGLGQLTADHEKEYATFRGDPMERNRIFQQKAEELFRTTTDAVPSRGARNLVQRNGYGAVKSYINQERESASRNQVALAHADIVGAANTLAQRAGQIALSTTDIYGKQLQVQSLLKQGARTAAIGKGVLGAEEQAKLEASIPEMISKAFLVSSMDTNPEHVAEMLNKGTFDAYLSSEDKAKLKSDARSAIPKAQEKREIDNLLNGISTHQAQWDKYLSKDPTLLSELEGSDDPFSKSLRNLVVKGDVDPVVQSTDVMRLEAKFDSLVKKKGDGSEDKSKFGKKATLLELKDIMKDVVDSRARGSISTEVANSYLKKLSEPLYNKIQGDHTGISQTPMNAGALGAIPAFQLYQMGSSVLQNFFSKNSKLSVDQKSQIVMDYLREFDSAKIKTQADSSALARNVIAQNVQKANPGLGLIGGIANKILHDDNTQTFIRGGKSDVRDAAKVPPKNNQPKVFKVGDTQEKDGETFYKWSNGEWRNRKES